MYPDRFLLCGCNSFKTGAEDEILLSQYMNIKPIAESDEKFRNGGGTVVVNAFVVRAKGSNAVSRNMDCHKIMRAIKLLMRHHF